MFIAGALTFALRHAHNPGIRRAFAILKYVPAVLWGLLVVAWVMSLWVSVGLFGLGRYGVYFETAELVLQSWEHSSWNPRLDFDMLFQTRSWLGRFAYIHNEDWRIVWLPIPLLVTLSLPLAITPFFGFPLWSYFAWTALVAAELGYYLRVA